MYDHGFIFTANAIAVLKALKYISNIEEQPILIPNGSLSTLIRLQNLFNLRDIH